MLIPCEQAQAIAPKSQRRHNRGRHNLRAITLLWILILLSGACQGPMARDRPWDKPIEIKGEGLTVKRPGAPPFNNGNSEDRRLGVSGGERGLRIHLDADPGSLNPLRTPSRWTLRIMMDTVFETLIRYHPTGELGRAAYEPGLAQAWEVSPGGREIRVFLNDKARWQDGKAVSALDVQFSIELAKSKRGGAPYHRSALSAVLAVEIVGPKRLRIRLEEPNAFVLRDLALLPILPEHLYRQRAFSQRSGEWIGSGPYRVSREGEDVLLVRDEDYWGARPAIKTVTFVREKDAAEALREAKDGQMDIIAQLIAAHYPGQLAVPGVSRNFSVLRLAPAEVSYVVLNTRHSPFIDGNARKAVASLVNREALVAQGGGLLAAAYGLTWPGGPGDGEAAFGVEKSSVQRAIDLLDRAGWRDTRGDGVRIRDGVRLMIIVLVTKAPHRGRDLVLASLRQAGFVIDLRVGTAAVLKKRMRGGEFDLAFTTWGGPADRDLSEILSSGAKNNFGGYRSPVVDELLRSIRNAWLPSQRRPLLATLGHLLDRSVPVVPLYSPDPRGLVHKRVLGLQVWNGWFSLRDLRLADQSAP